MGTYRVYVFCDECFETHPMSLRISLDDGPTDKQSIGDLYAGRELPPQVATLIDNQTVCPTTGKMILQRDNHQVFLVPVDVKGRA